MVDQTRKEQAGGPLAGLRVAAFESRMAGAMAEMIARQGGEPLVAPSMREIPLEQNPEAIAFARDLIAGRFGLVVFLTGVGTRMLAQAIETQVPREEWLEALGRTRVAARGPKPVAALRELKVRVDLAVPEPNTWREVVATLDEALELNGLQIAVQEYGQPSADLISALEAHGAIVTRVPVYRWALPEDLGPLRNVINELANGRVDAAMFTSAQQAIHLFQVATEMGLEKAVRDALHRQVVVASIGPTTSETLEGQGLVADIVPEHPKMGHLVAALASGWADTAKGAARRAEDGTTRVEVAPPPGAPLPESNARLHQSRFLRACRREPTDITPIWLMRQAGRYMAEYRDLRSKVTFLELCKRPELATEVTVHAATRLGVDAAILFADILLVLEPLGFSLEFARGEGPVIHNPVREAADVDRVRPLGDALELGFVLEAVRLIRAALPKDVPLIGFAGAPFTLACYAIEGMGSRHYERAKQFLYNDSGAFDVLMERLTEATSVYLNAQAAAGAQALQLFDSWVGTLSPTDYQRFVQPHMARLFASLPEDVPVIHFGTGTATLLDHQREAGGQVLGLDWRVELGRTWDRLGPGIAVQGNLDPVVLLGPVAEIERQADRILREAAGRPGHIFNLGHGILPQTPVENVQALVDYVHAWPHHAASEGIR